MLHNTWSSAHVSPMYASPDGLTKPPESAKWASLLSTSSFSTPISSKMLRAGVHTCSRHVQGARQAQYAESLYKQNQSDRLQ